MAKRHRGTSESQNIHFIGIGGIGMSALARYCLALNKIKGMPQKWSISGSDAAQSPITDSLKKEGINVKIGHKKTNLPSETAVVIYNRAISKDNPELIAAKRQKAHIIPYAKALGELTEKYTTIAITGSHGKSTTTALAGLALTKAGLDPTILLGTNLKELGGKNIRMGRPPYLVLEADDYGAAFLEYSPTISIVTNVDKEHMDFYRNFTNVKSAFLKFLSRTKKGGTLILNRDDKNLYSLKPRIIKIARQKKLDIVWYSTHLLKSRKLGLLRRAMNIPGEHNLSNAMAVYELGAALNLPEKEVFAAITAYHGAWRRFEYRGTLKIEKGNLKVYDDYAHHPTEIKATLQGFREKFPHSPLICVFQPHQAKRLQILFKDFQDVFEDADVLVLLPSYHVAGRDIVDKRYTSETLAQAIQKKYPKKKVYYLADTKNLKHFLAKTLSLNDCSRSPVLIMMGAGNIVNYTDALLK